MTDLPRAVILGLPQSGKKTLFQGLCRYLEIDYKKEPERVIPIGNNKFNCYEATIFTKYYKAPIEICYASGDNSQLTKEEMKQIVNENCQAIILLCSTSDENSIETLGKWEEMFKENENDFETKLVVLSRSEIQTEKTFALTQKLKGWCTDNFYELIPCNLRIPHLSWNSMEKEGVARVNENFECVMWASMDRSETRKTERIIDETPISSKKEIEQCACCHKTKQENNITLYRCGRCKLVSYCSRDCQVKDWKNHKAFCNQAAGIDRKKKEEEDEEKRVRSAEAQLASAMPSVPKSKEEEDLDRFSKLMAECRNVKANARNLPDAERKRRAAEVTAKIMRELNMGTDEEITQIENDLKDTSLFCVCSNNFHIQRTILYACKSALCSRFPWSLMRYFLQEIRPNLRLPLMVRTKANRDTIAAFHLTRVVGVQIIERNISLL